MDPSGYLIANLHSMFGHDKTAQVLGQPVENKDACLLCQYEKLPTLAARKKVIDALSSSALWPDINIQLSSPVTRG